MATESDYRIRVLLGRNGAGKSRYLRGLASQTGVRSVYISPERGGSLVYNSNTDTNASQGQEALLELRNKNQVGLFKSQTVSLIKVLELEVLRAFERDQEEPKYEETVALIQGLLENVTIARGPTGFDFRAATGGDAIEPENISSGESELVALAAECLVFAHGAKETDESSLLLIDEPDVHLHPDLQVRFVGFLATLVEQISKLKIVVATHSTAFVSGLSKRSDVGIAFMRPGDDETTYEPLDEVIADLLPAFGAHPLTQVFNQRPPLILEGEDDERFWQQAVRTSEGRLAIFPVVADSVDEMGKYEARASSVLRSIYDDAVAYSLRDTDDGEPKITDLGSVVRMKLNCRTAENLLLANDTLEMAGCDWETVAERAGIWIEAHPEHSRSQAMKEFFEGEADRQWSDLKDLRNLLLVLIDTNKPWEVLVGQAIAGVSADSQSADHSLRTYLGEKVCLNLLKLT